MNHFLVRQSRIKLPVVLPLWDFNFREVIYYLLKIWFPEIQSQDKSLSLLAGYFEYFIMFFRLVQYLKKE